MVVVDEVVYLVVVDLVVSVKMMKYKIIDFVKMNNWINKFKQLGVCKIQVGGGGGRCIIFVLYKVELLVSVVFGVIFVWVSVQIGMNVFYLVLGCVVDIWYCFCLDYV